MAYTDYLDDVQELFMAYYLRPAGPTGLVYWAERMDLAGGDSTAIIEAFANSSESNLVWGPITEANIETFVEEVFWSLFERAPAQAGIDFYRDGFLDGTFTAGTIVLDILNGAVDGSVDRAVLDNKLQYANNFTAYVEASGITYAGLEDGNAARALLGAVDGATVVTPTLVADQIASSGIADIDTFVMTESTNQVDEGSSVTYTVTAMDELGNPGAVSADTTFTFTVVGDTLNGAATAASGADVDPAAGTVTILAGESSATFDVDAVADGLVEGLEGFKVNLLDADYNIVDTETTAILDGAVGVSRVLTTDVDNIVGTSANDMVTGVFNPPGGLGGTILDQSTLTLGDSINGGAGDDTLKIFLNAPDTDLDLGVATISNVENFYLDVTANDDVYLNSNAFSTITIDGANDSLYVYEANPGAMTTVTGIDNEYVQVDFDAGDATAIHTVSSDSDGLDVEYYYDLDAATLDNTVDVSDVENTDVYVEVYGGENYTEATETITVTNAVDSGIELYTYLDSTGVAFTSNWILDGLDYVNLYSDMYHQGESSLDINMSISNSDGVYVEVEIYDANGVKSSSDNDTLNITLDNVTSDDNDSEIDIDDMETVNITVNGASYLSDIDIYSYNNGDYMDPQAVNIIANDDLFLEDLDMTDGGVANITITGAGNVNIESHGDNDGENWDASAATGNITLFTGYDEDNGNTVVTGIGDDRITVDTDETDVSTGAGDDFVDTDGNDYGLDADSGTLDGGDGTDTIAIDDGADLDADAAANISNFEILDVSFGTGTYNLNVEPGLVDVVANGGLSAPVVIENAAADTALTLNYFDDLDSITMELADDSGSDDMLELNLNAVDDDDDEVIDGETDAVVIATGYETINVASNATTESVDQDDDGDFLVPADYTNTVDLDAADMTDLVITGNAMTAVTFTDATALTFVDASGSDAGVDVDVANALTAPDAGVTFKGSDAADTYTASANGDEMQGNGGADALTLGLGEDTIRYAAVTDSQLTLTDTDDPADGEADMMTGFDTITDFNLSGTDIIELSASLGLATGDARADLFQKGAIGGAAAADMEDFIGDGVDFFDTGLVDRAAAFANDGTNGYLFLDANADGDFAQADDMVIQLAGVTALDIVDISFG